MITRTFYVLSATLVAGGLLVAAYFYSPLLFGGTQKYRFYTQERTPTDVLRAEEPNFVEGESFLSAGQYMQAERSFRKALENVTTFSLKVRIGFSLAKTLELEGKLSESIQMYRQLAASITPNVKTPLPRETLARWKAKAIQDMAVMFYTHPENRSVIVGEIFKEDPYTSLKKENDYESIKQLLEYATTFSPLAYAEIFSASWYSSQLVNTLQSSTTPQAKEYIGIINKRLLAAETDIERIKKTPDEASWLLRIYSRRAVVLGDLARLGVGEPALVDQAFEQVLESEKNAGSKDQSLTPFYYAAFLVHQYGVLRKEDIHRLMQSYKVGNESGILQSTKSYFVSARSVASMSRARTDILAVAKQEVTFKAYVTSLGWTDADFAKK